MARLPYPALALFLSTLVPACASHTDAQRRPNASSESRDASRDSADFAWDGEVAAGKLVEISNINGAIHVEASTDGVRVEAEKKATRSNPDDVRIEVVEHEGGLTVCAIHPGMTVEDGRCKASGSIDDDVTVDFVLHLPPQVRLAARTVNGSIKTAALASEVSAHTVNGSVTIGAAPRAEANAVNGSIKASITDVDDAGPLSFRTVNGSINVELPENARVDLSASTVHGRIKTDFPLQVRTGRGAGSSLRGSLGGGGRSVQLSTVNGSIRLRKPS